MHMSFEDNKKGDTRKRGLASVLLISIILFMIISYATALFSFDNYYEEFGWRHASAQYGGGGGGGAPPPSIPSVAAINVVSPEEGYNLLKDLSPGVIADILSEVNATKAALILELFDAETAFQILQEMTPATAGKLLNLMDPTKAILILELFDAETAFQILQKMTPATTGKLLNLMDSTKAAAIISLMGEGDGETVQNMINNNSTQAAQRVEEAVKMLTEGLTGQAKQDALSGLINALSEVDIDTLVTLLKEIALLPETPQVSADIISGFTLMKTIDLVSTWTKVEDLDTLGSILDHLDLTFFQDLYRGLVGSERAAVYPHLSTTLVSALPEVGDFTVTELDVSPMKLEPGDTATISFTLTNNGNESDVYTVTLRHEDQVIEVYSGALGAEESMVFTETVTVGEVGVYDVEAGEESHTYTVTQLPRPEPADIRALGIEVDPLTVNVGGEVSVSVSVSNRGEEEGTETVELYVDDTLVDSEGVTLAGGEEDTLEFTLTANYEPGTYTVKIGQLEDVFIVEKEASVRPWATIITLVIIIVSIGLFALIETGIIKTDILSKIRL